MIRNTYVSTHKHQLLMSDTDSTDSDDYGPDVRIESEDEKFVQKENRSGISLNHYIPIHVEDVDTILCMKHIRYMRVDTPIKTHRRDFYVHELDIRVDNKTIEEFQQLIDILEQSTFTRLVIIGNNNNFSKEEVEKMLESLHGKYELEYLQFDGVDFEHEGLKKGLQMLKEVANTTGLKYLWGLLDDSWNIRSAHDLYKNPTYKVQACMKQMKGLVKVLDKDITEREIPIKSKTKSAMKR